MPEEALYFVLPRNRLRDVGETVEQCDEHFWGNGHSVRMIVFDDSSPSNQSKYYSLLEQTSHTWAKSLGNVSGDAPSAFAPEGIYGAAGPLLNRSNKGKVHRSQQFIILCAKMWRTNRERRR